VGRSQETFSKKEKEKNRLKKRKEKEEKKEERKANATKGKTLEEMMAYVDENGNISSVPPDPQKKRVFNVEDVRIDVPPQVDEPEDAMHTGVVTFFNESKGYGFIRDLATQEGIFVHISMLTAPLKEGDKVSFQIGRNPKGSQAINIKPA
jgi:cold shock CspA family protein